MTYNLSTYFPIHRKLKRYFRNTSGATVIVFAMSLPVLVAMVGVTIDIARYHLEKERLSSSLDKAALAAAGSSQMTIAEREARMEEFFRANYAGGENVPFDVNMEIVDDSLKVSASSALPTTFMRLAGYSELNVSHSTIVQREVSGLEVALVLDVTGSMQGSSIRALREASWDFIDVIFNRIEKEEYVRIGLVPYAATVNVGDIGPNIVNYPISASDNADYDPDSPGDWAGCVMARTDNLGTGDISELDLELYDLDYTLSHDMVDTSIERGGKWDAFWWHDTPNDLDDNPWDITAFDDPDDLDQPVGFNLPFNQCNNRRTPNLGCPMTNPIMPLNHDETALKTAVNDLNYWCRGGTLGNLGMSWGWRVLSHQAPFSQGAPYDNFQWRKAIVMMTDGQNQLWRKPGIDSSSDFSAYGRIGDNVLGTTSRSTGLDIVNERFEATCEMMKDLGITVYTVTFGLNNNSTKDLYRDCATDSNKYYDADGPDDLVGAYNDIAKELSNLFISQ